MGVSGAQPIELKFHVANELCVPTRLFWCLSLVTLVEAFIVSRVPLDGAGKLRPRLGARQRSGMLWEDTTRRRFALDPVGTGLVVELA